MTDADCNQIFLSVPAGVGELEGSKTWTVACVQFWLYRLSAP